MQTQNRPGEKNNERTDKQENQNPTYNEGSKSDPQMTELEGLKEGGKSPHVHQDDKPLDDHGKQDA